jgi:DNA-binding protein HU-beta
MKKTELIEQVATRTGLTNALAGAAIDAIGAAVQAEVASGGKVEIPGLGAFTRAHRSARTARNPQTGATVAVPARHVPAFKPGTAFMDAVR